MWSSLGQELQHACSRTTPSPPCAGMYSARKEKFRRWGRRSDLPPVIGPSANAGVSGQIRIEAPVGFCPALPSSLPLSGKNALPDSWTGDLKKSSIKEAGPFLILTGRMVDLQGPTGAGQVSARVLFSTHRYPDRAGQVHVVPGSCHESEWAFGDGSASAGRNRVKVVPSPHSDSTAIVPL